ncbi:MAG: very short patch repair endonuclease [Firmicutes bacterium]|nr:very short patch repair endonuclease [Bacillota bacterium]
MDVYDKKKRSEVMARIKSTGNQSTEEIFRQLLIQAGLTGWEFRKPKLPGKPDFVFEEYKIAVFIDGCFWHGCPHCYDGHIPKSNTKYWAEKIRKNKLRDRKNSQLLRQIGWSVIRIWECKLKCKPELQIQRLVKKLEEKSVYEIDF